MQLTVKKILVPIAFTENCIRAKEYADAIAAQFGAEVELLHVVEASPYEVYQQRGIVADVPIYESALGSVPRASQRYIVKDVMEETRNELDKIAASNGSKVKYKTDVKHGHSVDEILRVIDEYKPDLVVMATHGRTGVRHMLLGSVAERIVRLSPVPVLTVRAAE
jgi:nucleotide-binding universal stress UspA family protein